MVIKIKIYSNRLVNTTTPSATTLKKYNYNYSGALTSISDTNTSDYSIKIKSQWKYNSSSFLREYTEFDTSGFYLNYDCQSIYGLPISVSTLGSIWRYKYSMFGTREQKRLLYSPSGDSCSKQLGWVYYMQGAGGDTRTIYKGKQTAKDTLTDSGRRVYFWADKYISAGGLSISPDSTKEVEIKDALGSVRALAVVTKDLNSTITTTDYKPFGDSLRTNGTLPDDAFIGMELDGERNQYHFNARSYDPQLSRFFAPDLLFDKFPNQSPYSYSNNSPLNFKDPSGMITYGLIESQNEIFNKTMESWNQTIDWLNTFRLANCDGNPYSSINGINSGGGGGGGNDGNAYGGGGGGNNNIYDKVYNSIKHIYGPEDFYLNEDGNYQLDFEFTSTYMFLQEGIGMLGGTVKFVGSAILDKEDNIYISLSFKLSVSGNDVADISIDAYCNLYNGNKLYNKESFYNSPGEEFVENGFTYFGSVNSHTPKNVSNPIAKIYIQPIYNGSSGASVPISGYTNSLTIHFPKRRK